MKNITTDITDVRCADGKLYVSMIFECFNGEIVALGMRDNMKTVLYINALKQLREKYSRLGGPVLYSSRGYQYASCDVRREFVTNGLIQILIGTAHCYDNVRMEIFLPL